MIVPVDQANIDQAAEVHSISWKESHRPFCPSDFIELHTPEHQRIYLQAKQRQGGRIYLLIEEAPIGIVSVNDNLIEDLYVLPDKQNMGYGTALLQFAIGQCSGIPTLWILENNTDAERLYRRLGFAKTGRRSAITNGLDEIEFKLCKSS